MRDQELLSLIYAFQQSLDMGIALIKEKPDLISARTGLGETPLHFLAVENCLAAVQELVNRGAQVNTVNDVGTTPLSDAASLGYVELVQFLIQSGSSLHLAGQNDPTIHEAVRSGNVEVVRIILDAGAYVNQQNDLSETPLHLAVEEDMLEVAKLLLERGADPSITRIFDETALEVARDSGSQQCFALLSTKH
jgi:uncharacterized protein